MNNNINLIRENKIINAKLIFSFSINKKKYIVLDFPLPIFTDNSKYNNLNVVEIYKTEENKIYVQDIKENEWKKIKDFLQENIFNNI